MGRMKQYYHQTDNPSDVPCPTPNVDEEQAPTDQSQSHPEDVAKSIKPKKPSSKTKTLQAKSSVLNDQLETNQLKLSNEVNKQAESDDTEVSSDLQINSEKSDNSFEGNLEFSEPDINIII